ncbi:hypothetical protein BD410DRAFT_784724 [Rickenella mellea]|uniref:PX domain-containing protein n=1 Tax=Rickenella mellea TaxID=50990 RepID=A0A4Y7QEB5_9AGAM|nr:hypothetical protein BD410DRAFT_784724 [Rickenella mellea]
MFTAMNNGALMGNQGNDDSPPVANTGKRAVERQPPGQFTAQVLPPQKQGRDHSYGMRIYPISNRRQGSSTSSLSTSPNNSRSSVSVSSDSSGSSTSSSYNREYEVWRRWEDCLLFQDLLEREYAKMSREKRVRLERGKGVKKDGVYPHQDPLRRLQAASSFESLPPGPDPNMIAKDLHDVLPRLSKKGAVFRTPAALIQQRGEEFRLLIEGLWRPEHDLPTLIVQLRNLPAVRDFFGIWRRDVDRMEKDLEEAEKTEQKGKKPEMSPDTRQDPSLRKSGPQGILVRPAAGPQGQLRPRSNTAPGTTEAPNPHLSMSAVSRSSTGTHVRFVQPAPASAPAGMTFTFAMPEGDPGNPDDHGYFADQLPSDMQSLHVSSPQSPQRSPRSVRHASLPRSHTGTIEEEEEFNDKSDAYSTRSRKSSTRSHEGILKMQVEMEFPLKVVEEDDEDGDSIYTHRSTPVPHRSLKDRAADLSASRPGLKLRIPHDVALGDEDISEIQSIHSAFSMHPHPPPRPRQGSTSSSSTRSSSASSRFFTPNGSTRSDSSSSTDSLYQSAYGYASSMRTSMTDSEKGPYTPRDEMDAKRYSDRRDSDACSGHYRPDSMASMRSVMTQSSMDAVIPRRAMSPPLPERQAADAGTPRRAMSPPIDRRQPVRPMMTDTMRHSMAPGIVRARSPPMIDVSARSQSFNYF